MMMVGMFDVDVRQRMLGITEVAELNTATGMHANQLYSPGSDFVWSMANGNTGHRADLLAALKATHP
jgi:hypothetical protein